MRNRSVFSRPHRFLWPAAISLIFLAVAFPLFAAKVTTPKQHFGHNIGDDYFLAGYAQLSSYWKKLDRESDRVTVVEIGKTAEGRTMLMAIVTSPSNQGKLGRYKDISKRLGLAEGLADSQARKLAKEGKAVVWIDGGLHATEVVGGQHIIELVYQMASRDDEETLRILDNVITLVVPANPDGLDLIADWYMREKDPAKRLTSGLPRLYQKYIGHDNNRDFYMVTQPESEAISRVMYYEWFPQVVYNHHQTGPTGTVLFCPPFRDPFNYLFDPLVPMGVDLVGSAMHNRFVAEGKPGATMRSGAGYSTWWSGGLRTTTYYHNMIGILTEIIGNPTPMEVAFVPQKHLPKGDYPFPVAPQKWHFRQSIDYSITADKAILDLAAKLKEDFLYKFYLMGRNSLERSSRDHWTITPKRIAAVEAAYAKDNPQRPAAPEGRAVGGGFTPSIPAKYFDLLRDPADRDPRGFIIPSTQPDFQTATKFVNALVKSGIAIHRATTEFQVAGKTYPAGSYVVKCNQAFRPHILSMFEPQDHPHDVPYPGGPPTPPYDNAGWTLAFQMGVEFDRILDGFDGPFEKISGFTKVPPGKVGGNAGSAGYLLSHAVNDTFIVTNRLLKDGEDVYWLKSALTAGGMTYPAGAVYVPAKQTTRPKLEKAAKEFGLNIDAVDAAIKTEAFKLKPVRIGLWDTYGGSMPSGWTRWLLEQFEFPFEVVYPQRLDAGDLRSKYDVLVFVGGAIPLEDRRDGAEGEFRRAGQPSPESVPEEYRSWLGSVTVEKTVPLLLKFLEDGGTLLAVGSSIAMGYHAKLPLADALIEKMSDGTERRLTREKFFIPGSVLEAKVDNTNPLAFGMMERVNVFFNNSPVFRILPEAVIKNVNPVVWFDGKTPLRSGWAWGQNYLEGSVAVVEATVGKGRLCLYGPEVLFRAQPHGTFKLVFNGIYWGSADLVLIE